MRQAERCIKARGFATSDNDLRVSGRVQAMTLNELSNGMLVSQLLGQYGFFRELFSIVSRK